jgi:hypothetical protein
MGRENQVAIGRRTFLGLLASGLVAIATEPALATARHGRKATKVVFRLSTHGRRTCRACKGHAANRFYRTRRAADRDRAHVGCNCAIVTQTIDRRLAKRYFGGRRKVFDLRVEARA